MAKLADSIAAGMKIGALPLTQVALHYGLSPLEVAAFVGANDAGLTFAELADLLEALPVPHSANMTAARKKAEAAFVAEVKRRIEDRCAPAAPEQWTPYTMPWLYGKTQYDIAPYSPPWWESAEVKAGLADGTLKKYTKSNQDGFYIQAMKADSPLGPSGEKFVSGVDLLLAAKAKNPSWPVWPPGSVLKVNSLDFNLEDAKKLYALGKLTLESTPKSYTTGEEISTLKKMNAGLGATVFNGEPIIDDANPFDGLAAYVANEPPKTSAKQMTEYVKYLQKAMSDMIGVPPAYVTVKPKPFAFYEAPSSKPNPWAYPSVMAGPPAASFATFDDLAKNCAPRWHLSKPQPTGLVVVTRW